MDEPSTSSGASSDRRSKRPRSTVQVRVSEPDYMDRISRMLAEEIAESEDEESDVIDDSDADPDFVLPTERHNSEDSSSDLDPDLEQEQEPIIMGEPQASLTNSDVDSDVEMEEEFPQQDHPIPPYVFGRLRKNEHGPPYYWCTKEPPRAVRTPAHNVIRGLPGLTAIARALGNSPDIRSVWELLFDRNMIQSIVTYTNVKLSSVRERVTPTTEVSNYRNTDEIEINAYIGILLLSSILKTNGEDMSSMFSKDVTGRPVFTATMSYKRYELLTSCLRFDNATTRDERKVTEKAAAIIEIFSMLINNSQRAYSVSELLTIDEMLVPFRGRCPFKVYMPKKPKKYGIKIMCLCDAKTSFLYNAYIYTGAGSDGQGLSDQEQQFLMKPTQSVVKLCKPIEKSNKNITADNYFSSIETPDELRKRGLTYVGTMRKNKLAIPHEFLANNDRPVGSAIHAFNGGTTLVSFVPKKNRAVILISSMHHSSEMNEEKQKPEIICFYNETKCGVDLIDMKCSTYSSSRRTRRWPLAVFYRMVSIASVNAFVMFLSYRDSPLINRFDFIKRLGREMIVPHLRRRLMVQTLPRSLKTTIKNVLMMDEEQQDNQERIPSDKLEKRKTCSKCPWEKRRKTAYKCIKCSLPVCLECSRKVCTLCAVDYVQ